MDNTEITVFDIMKIKDIIQSPTMDITENTSLDIF
jgi:hypothetical protein